MKLTLLTLLHVAAFSYHVSGQCIAAGALNPLSSISVATGGTVAWTTPGAVDALDGTLSQSGATLGILATLQTEQIQCTGYGFSIPATASICGIEVTITKKSSGLIVGGGVTDNTVKLLSGGSVVGTNHASGSTWSSSLTSITYGNSTDLWGVAWTPAMINSSTFGAIMSANLAAGLASVFLGAQIDNVEVNVYYANPLSAELTYWDISGTGNCAELSWSVYHVDNVKNFYVERGIGDNFEKVAIYIAASQADFSGQHNFKDCDNTRVRDYKLFETDLNGSVIQLGKTLHFEAEIDDVLIYPNPASDFVKFESAAKSSVTVFDLTGALLLEMELNEQNGFSQEINTTEFQSGAYMIMIRTADNVRYNKISIN